MNRTGVFLTALLLAAALSPSLAARGLDAELRSKGSDPGAFFGPGGGFNIPGFGAGGGPGWAGGYGGGYGGPGGGHSYGGVVRPSVVCTEKGPCYKKKLTCPAKCFYSYSHSGKHGGGGGGGGGCTMDCKDKCIAYC